MNCCIVPDWLIRRVRNHRDTNTMFSSFNLPKFQPVSTLPCPCDDDHKVRLVKIGLLDELRYLVLISHPFLGY